MVIAGSVSAVFAKLGVGSGRDELPYDPYVDPEPQRRLRRVSSQSMRPRAPSLVQSACLNVHKIPAIVAVSGSPGAPAPKKNPAGGSSLNPAGRNRHSVLGWHQLLSPDDSATRPPFPRPVATARSHDVPTGIEAPIDRSQTDPTPINLPTSFDFCDLDQDKRPHSAPSHQTTFRQPDIRVTPSERRPSELRYQYTPQPTTSYDFVDMDRNSPAPLPVPRSISPAPSSTHRSPSPSMSQSHCSVSPTAGHTPYLRPQGWDSTLRTSHTPQRSTTPLQRLDSASSTTRTTMSESYDFIGMNSSFPTTIHENSEYGAYYCTSPTPISAHGSARGASRGNTYDSRQGDAYDATRGGIYASTQDAYDATQVYDSARPRGGATFMTYGQTTGLTTIIGEMEGYNQAHMPRSASAPSPPLTATTSADGTIDSPYGD